MELLSSIAKAVITLIICIIGLIGNVIVIFVITALKEYRKSVTNWYVLQLALADLLFLLTLPFQVSEDIQGAWLYPEWLCKAMNTIRFHNYYASILFFTIMSVDRYIAVCHSLSNRLNQFREMKSVVIISISIWIIALLLCIPIMLYSFKIGFKPDCLCRTMFPLSKTSLIEIEELCREETYTEMEFQECQKKNILSIQTGKEDYCVEMSTENEANFGNETALSYSGMQAESNEIDYYEYNYEESYYPTSDYYFDNTEIPGECYYARNSSGLLTFVLFNFTTMFIVPFIIMSICYGLIIYRVSSSNLQSRTKSTSSQVTSRKSKREKQVTKSQQDKVRVTRMCAILVMNFLLCWLLFHAIHIAKIVGISNATAKYCKELSVASTLLAYLNSALNPYIYSYMSANFLKKFRKVFCPHLKGKRGSYTFGFTVRFSNVFRITKTPPGSSKVNTKFTGTSSDRKMSTEQLATTELRSTQNQAQRLSPVTSAFTDKIES